MNARHKRKKPPDDLHAKQLRRVQAVMQALGVNAEYKRLKPDERDHILKCQAGAPQIIVADGVKNDPHAQRVACEIQDALNAAVIEIDGTDYSILLKDCFRVMAPLSRLFQHAETRATGRPRLDALAEAFYAKFDLIEVTFKAAVVNLFNTISSGLLKNSRIDDRLYCFRLPDRSPSRNEFWRFQLQFVPAQIEREERDSVSQLLYRSGGGFEDEVQWISWPGDQLGLPAVAKEYPVFVSKHALKQFRDRMLCTGSTWILESFVFDSLREPVFASGYPNTKLVEFRLASEKLGYFVVDVQEHWVVLRTFLFLTMSGTPEGDMLFRKLGLKRIDREYLELDKLSTYLLSDIKQDAQLRQVFNECGCGHLLKIVPEQFVDPAMTNRGIELRKYLGNRMEKLLADVGTQQYQS